MRVAGSVELIGVRFDGSGRAAGQGAAATVLRGAGLRAALPEAMLADDVDGGQARPERGAHGFVNEAALVAMVDSVHHRVTSALAAGRFPLLYGGDCAVLLGAVPALRRDRRRPGLLFIDAHQDATTVEHSEGEAANSEIALLLGTYGGSTPDAVASLSPALDTDAIVMVGQRDAGYLRRIGMPSIAETVLLYPHDVADASPARIAAESVTHLNAHSDNWWLHVDLDVLAADQFAACGAATDPETPGGLTWASLITVVRAALADSRCGGFSVGVYNTDLDPHRQDADRIVEFLDEVFAAR